MFGSRYAKFWNSNSGLAIGNTKQSKENNSYIMFVQTSIYDLNYSNFIKSRNSFSFEFKSIYISPFLSDIYDEVGAL